MSVDHQPRYGIDWWIFAFLAVIAAVIVLTWFITPRVNT
jgi:hypothetical protein